MKYVVHVRLTTSKKFYFPDNFWNSVPNFIKIITVFSVMKNADILTKYLQCVFHFMQGTWTSDNFSALFKESVRYFQWSNMQVDGHIVPIVCLIFALHTYQ